MENLVENAKVNIGNFSPSGITNPLKSLNNVVVPPLSHAILPAHLRVQACIAEWSGLQERYVEEDVRHGLWLDRVADFDGELKAPVPTYEISLTHCPHVCRLLRGAAAEGPLALASRHQLTCVLAPFAIDNTLPERRR